MSALWRKGALIATMMAVALLCGTAAADVRVPLHLQAQLVRRLASFDRNFAARAGAAAKVLVMYHASNSESRSVAGAFRKALDASGNVGGIPTQVTELPFAGAGALADQCRAERIAMVYFSVGLEPEMVAVGNALTGVDVLTIGASAAHAEKGAVVGFDLEESHPKIVVNVTRAKAQRVSFKAELLKLARLVE